MKINRKKMTVAKLPRSVKRMFPGVKECYDSNKAVDVDVSLGDIKNSKPLDPTNCAVAKAFKRFTNVDAAIIGLATSYLIKGKTAIRFRTPGSVQREIIDFDRHGAFEEGHYYLAPFPKSSRLGMKQSGDKKSKDHQPKRKFHKMAKVRVLESGADYETVEGIGEKAHGDIE